MRRDLSTILAVLLLSCGMAVAANLGWHNLDWIRRVTHAEPVSTAQDKKSPIGLTAAQVLEHLANGTACFVDAREAHEYTDGHLRGAAHLPASAVYEKIEDIIAVISTEEKVIVYCGSRECESGHEVAEVLRQYNFIDVELYANGWEEIESSCKFDDCIVEGEGI